MGDLKKLIGKAAVLIEALPYIQRFRRKVVVVKYGGSTMGSGDPDAILRDIVFMGCVGIRPVVVHGGGNAISARLKERGIAPRFVSGLRVTDAKTMKVVEEVLSEVNRGIVARIGELGGCARTVGGRDGVLRAKRHFPEVEKSGRGERADGGYVGDVAEVAGGPLRELLKKDVIPVIAPIGTDAEGNLYNINADTAAGEVAAALKAEKLILLTDVRGILRNPGDDRSLIETLRIGDIETLKAAGALTGGMLPKVRAGVTSVRAGVPKTHIVDGRLPHSILLEVFTDAGIGTEIVKG